MQAGVLTVKCLKLIFIILVKRFTLSLRDKEVKRREKCVGIYK